MKVLNMKKLLLVLILSLFSHSSFSAYKNIKDMCSMLDLHITNAVNMEDKIVAECTNNQVNKRKCDKSADGLLDINAKVLSQDLDRWNKLGCAEILYK
jgi:hypothetical protein